MNLTLLAVAVVVLFVGALGTKTFTDKNSESPTSSPEVKSQETTEPSESPVATSAPSTLSPKPTSTSTAITTTPVVTQKPVSSSDWVYPGAKTIESGSKLVLESADSSDAITAWYKSKIEGEGYNIRNSIKTSANGVVKNVVQAVNGQKSVSVEISKNPSSSVVRIEVETTSL